MKQVTKTSVERPDSVQASASVLDQLTHLFAHKAEWLNQELYDLFYTPGYLPELKLNQSCVLIGGRGTGKTTVLRGLSYEGQYKLSKKHITEWDFFGIYYKIDSNSVSALSGLGLSDEEWRRPFAHYFSLIISSLILKMVLWYQELPEYTPFELDADAWLPFQKSLSLSPAQTNQTLTISSLRKQLAIAIAQLDVYVNNIQDPDVEKPKFSMLGAPLDSLLDALETIPFFRNKFIYILLDEYENFSDYQQRTINTLIKQSAGRRYCFKVGVRELGWRVRHTQNDQELHSPNDFRRIKISDHLKGAKFRDFAETICNRRIAKLEVDSAEVFTVKKLLPGLTNLEEANLLGVKSLADKILSNTKSKLSATEREELSKLQPALVWFAHEWETHKKRTSVQALQSLLANPTEWKRRFDNYLYAILFTIKAGKTGIRKYYTGWETYVLMANGNIRFLLQLVEAALREQTGPNDTKLTVVTPDKQTTAAVKIGNNNLYELEGVDVKGRKIMRLVQGLGRVFQIFAEAPFGRAPEVNQFYVPELNEESADNDSEVVETREVLESALSHLALQRAPSNKLSRESSKGYDYFVHPIFSAYFRFGHRKKRKIIIHAPNVLGLIKNQTQTSNDIVSRTKKDLQESESPATAKKEAVKKKTPKKKEDDGPQGQYSLFG